MKKTLLCAGLLLGSFITANAQTTIFEDSFETYEDFALEDVGNWTLLDLDGLNTYGIEQGNPPVSVDFENSEAPMAYFVMNSTATNPELDPIAWGGHTGDKCMASMGGEPAGGINANNDHLISPQIQLGTSGNMLKFWAKGISAQYPEKFKVGISTTGNAPSDFTFITTGSGIVPPQVWTEYSYDLDAYQGQNVYITVNCVSADGFALLVDDFSVTALVLGTEDFFKSNFAVYPNPTTDVLNISSSNNGAINAASITDMNGRTVKTVSMNAVSEAQINISDLTAGVYFLNVTSDAGTGTSKIVKK